MAEIPQAGAASAGPERLDSFPYRHRVRSIMGAPPQFVAPGATVQKAAERMRQLKIGALLVEGEAPGIAAGIVSERDIMNAIARDGAAALVLKVSGIMSAPVASVPENALLYVAMGRMERMGFRHLAAVDGAGRVVGVVSSRALLKLRAGKALVLGDAVATASGAAALKSVRDALPALAGALLEDEVSALKIAGVISQVLRDTTARAAELAEAEMAEEGWGPPPARYALLVLGSGGRGESLLAADQDNAIVHDGGETEDRWFAELGRRACDTLNAAGIPFCKGGVMASRPEFRRSLKGWREQIGHWIAKPEGQNLLNVDIFYDFRRARGDPALADELRRDALTAAGASPPFLRMLAANVEDAGSALGYFGRFRTENGRVDLKRGGLLPLTAFARVVALKRGVADTATAVRLAAAAAGGAVQADEADRLRQVHETLLGFVLVQQLADLAAGTKPSARVELARLGRAARTRLKEAVKGLDGLPLLVRDLLTAP
jgi:signal-transduction protein with cAMP-binding, CBS, and nucleotidyltransferase domain